MPLELPKDRLGKPIVTFDPEGISTERKDNKVIISFTLMPAHTIYTTMLPVPPEKERKEGTAFRKAIKNMIESSDFIFSMKEILHTYLPKDINFKDLGRLVQININPKFQDHIGNALLDKASVEIIFHPLPEEIVKKLAAHANEYVTDIIDATRVAQAVPPVSPGLRIIKLGKQPSNVPVEWKR